MAAAKKRRRPGFEPALGRPDPEDQPDPVPTGPSIETHYPHSNGTVCGLVFTHASRYDPVAPTCVKCATWLAAAKRVTAARHPETVEPSHATTQVPPPPAAPATPREGGRSSEPPKAD